MKKLTARDLPKAAEDYAKLAVAGMSVQPILDLVDQMSEKNRNAFYTLANQAVKDRKEGK